MDIWHTLNTVASIFLLLLAGYGSKRLGALNASDAAVVNSLVVNLTMPAFIFVSVHNKPITPAMVKAPVVGFVMEMVVVGIAYCAARALRLDRRTTGALMLVSAFGNTGFLGYPVVTAAFRGDKHAILSAVMFDEFAMALPLNSVGVALAVSFAGCRFERSSLLEFLKTPLFPSTIAALLLRQVSVPPLVMTTLGYLAAGTVPLAMISIGLSLTSRVVKSYPYALATALILKMVVLPALVWLVLPLTSVGGVVKQVVVLESAMPSAVFSGVVAARYGANGAFAAAAVFASTLASVIMIPAVLMLVG
ncbi:MAG: AEC family transporter [Armatimonadota bacterium]